MMDHWTDLALAVDVTATGSAVQVAAILGEPPAPGSVEWHAQDVTDVPVERERAWQLLQLRIALAAGMGPRPVLIGLVRHGSTWDEIAMAAGLAPASARERWAAVVPHRDG